MHDFPITFSESSLSDFPSAARQIIVVAIRLRADGPQDLLFWDPLRGDPRFEKIVASLALKE